MEEVGRRLDSANQEILEPLTTPCPQSQIGLSAREHRLGTAAPAISNRMRLEDLPSALRKKWCENS